MIRLTNISKRYGDNEILRGVNLEVANGEVCVLLGPSGGGKSTLLRTINGLETFDADRSMSVEFNSRREPVPIAIRLCSRFDGE